MNYDELSTKSILKIEQNKTIITVPNSNFHSAKAVCLVDVRIENDKNIISAYQRLAGLPFFSYKNQVQIENTQLKTKLFYWENPDGKLIEINVEQ